MSDAGYAVKTRVFEGPLDVLLLLIEKRKLFINDVSLAAITDDYIEYVRNLQEFSVRDTAHFILVASTLVLIKSRSLLPDLPLTVEEESDIEDLEMRLRIFRELKRIGAAVREQFGARMVFFRTPSFSQIPVFVPPHGCSAASFLKVAERLCANFPVVTHIPQAVVQKVISLEETIRSLTKRIQSNIKMRFKEFAPMGQRHKLEVVVSFLAMLELVKQGLISVQQENAFADIGMETADPRTPNYAA